jgi:hypothetical protein
MGSRLTNRPPIWIQGYFRLESSGMGVNDGDLACFAVAISKQMLRPSP